VADQNDILVNVIVRAINESTGNLNTVAKDVKSIGAAATETSGGVNALHVSLTGFIAKLSAGANAFVAVNMGLGMLRESLAAIMGPLQEGIEKWSRSSLVMKQLSVVWESAGRSLPIKEMLDYNKQLSANSQFSAESLNGALKYYAGVGRVADSQLPRIMKLTADISAFKPGLEPAHAALVISRVLQGNFDALGRMLGIRIPQQIKASKDLNEVLGYIEKRVGGMSESAMEQWTAKSAKISEYWGLIGKEVGEIVGSSLLPTLEGVRARVEGLKDAFIAANKEGKFEGVKQFLSFLGEAFLIVRDTIVQSLSVIWQSLQKTFVNADYSIFLNAMREVQKVVVWIAGVIGKGLENKWQLWGLAVLAVFRIFGGVFTSISTSIAAMGTALASVIGRIRAETQAIRENNAAHAENEKFRKSYEGWRQSAIDRMKKDMYPAPPSPDLQKSAFGAAKPYQPGTGPVPKSQGSYSDIGGAPAGYGSKWNLGAPIVSSLAVGASAAVFGADTETTVKVTALNAGVTFLVNNMDKVLSLGSRVGRELGTVFASLASRVLTWAVSMDFAQKALSWLGDLVPKIASAIMGIPGLVGVAIGAAIAALLYYRAMQWKKGLDQDTEEMDRFSRAIIEKGAAAGGKLGKVLVEEQIKALNPEEAAQKVKDNQDYIYALSIQRANQLRNNDAGGAANTQQQIDQYREMSVQLSEQIRLVNGVRDGLSGMNDSEAFAKSVKYALTFDEALKKVKEELGDLDKASDRYYTTQSKFDDLGFAKLRAEIAATATSQETAEKSYTELSMKESQRRISQKQKETDETIARENDAMSKLRQRLDEEERLQAGNDDELKKIHMKREEMEREHREKIFDLEKKLIDAMIAEQQKYLEKIKEIEDKLRENAQKMTDASLEGQKALQDLYAKGMLEASRYLQTHSQVLEQMERAQSLIETNPQKAIEIAQSARSTIAGTVVDIQALYASMIQFETQYRDQLVEMEKKGKGAEESKQIEQRRQEERMGEYQQSMAGGQWKEAQQTASEMRRSAAEAFKAAPSGTDEEAAARKQFEEAVNAEREARKAELEEAKKRHEESINITKQLNDTILKSIEVQRRLLEAQGIVVKDQLKTSEEASAGQTPPPEPVAGQPSASQSAEASSRNAKDAWMDVYGPGSREDLSKETPAGKTGPIASSSGQSPIEQGGPGMGDVVAAVTKSISDTVQSIAGTSFNEEFSKSASESASKNQNASESLSKSAGTFSDVTALLQKSADQIMAAADKYVNARLQAVVHVEGGSGTTDAWASG
jgi:hypothetical protein